MGYWADEYTWIPSEPGAVVDPAAVQSFTDPFGPSGQGGYWDPTGTYFATDPAYNSSMMVDYGLATNPSTGQPGWLSSIASGMNSLLGTNLTAASMGPTVQGLGGTMASLLGSQAQAAAAKDAAMEQRRQFDISQLNLKPWLTAGQNALTQMNTMTGQSTPTLNMPNTPTVGSFNFDPANYYNNPAYQAILKSGTQAIDASAAARGNFGSGSQLAELQKLGMTTGAQYQQQDYAQQLGQHQQNVQDLMGQYNIDANTALQMYNSQLGNQNQQWNRLASLAGTGQTSANTLGQMGQTMATSIGQSGQTGANALAAGYTGMAGGLGTMAGYQAPPTTAIYNK